ncbi:hypothetical protein [Streptomyces sp. NPDC049879]|uniref:hypothetical protein n=1 Tax=Streptomyces sp. NPDC049879 TaxID=3365598 RepID=UPI00379BB55E
MDTEIWGLPAPAVLGGGAVLAVLALVLAVVGRRRSGQEHDQDQETPGVTLAQVVATIAALICTGIGAFTAWGFTERSVGIDLVWERAALFLAGEIILLANALAARANLQRTERAGAPGVMVWVISVFLAVPAVSESIPAGGGLADVNLAGASWRIVLGPLGAAFMWHMAMGIELRARDADARNRGFASVVGRRLQRRLLIALGVALDQDLTEEEAARQRALEEAVRIVVRQTHVSGPFAKQRLRRLDARLAERLRVAGVARDPEARARLRAEYAVAHHASSLRDLVVESPWEAATPPTPPAPAIPAPAAEPAPPPAAEAVLPAPAPAAPAEPLPSPAPAPAVYAPVEPSTAAVTPPADPWAARETYSGTYAAQSGRTAVHARVDVDDEVSPLRQPMDDWTWAPEPGPEPEPVAEQHDQAEFPGPGPERTEIVRQLWLEGVGPRPAARRVPLSESAIRKYYAQFRTESDS